MFKLTDSQKEWVRMIGVGFVILGNLILTWLGLSAPSKRTELLDAECEKWLMTHDEYTVPPPDCDKQLKYLQRRVNDEVKEHDF